MYGLLCFTNRCMACNALLIDVWHEDWHHGISNLCMKDKWDIYMTKGISVRT